MENSKKAYESYLNAKNQKLAINKKIKRMDQMVTALKAMLVLTLIGMLLFFGSMIMEQEQQKSPDLELRAVQKYNA